MSNTQKQVFRFSLFLIVAYWLYDVFKLTQPPREIPDSTTDLLLRVALLKVSVFAILYLLLIAQGDNFFKIGWRREKWKAQVLRGAGLGVLIFALTIFVFDPLINAVLPKVDNGPGIMAHFTDMSMLPVWLLSGILGGGFVEEFQRVFVITRFEKWKGNKIIIGVVAIDVLSFGIGHLYQGVAGAVSAGLSGLLFALVYLRKRSFIEAFTCHAVYDIIGITIGHIMMNQSINTNP